MKSTTPARDGILAKPQCRWLQRAMELASVAGGEPLAAPGAKTLNLQGIFMQENGCEVLRNKMSGCDLVFTAPKGSARNLTQAKEALVGVDLNQQERRNRVRPERSSDGALRVDGDLDRDGLDSSDFHARLTSFSMAMLSSTTIPAASGANGVIQTSYPPSSYASGTGM